MIISSFLIPNGHAFQSTTEHEGMWVGIAPGDVVANQHQGISVKPIFRSLKP